MQRIAVIGSGGAGKSTVARELGERLGLPVVHLDQIFWRPGWQALPLAEWQAQHAELCAETQWVQDGNYGSTMDHRLAACDAVVFLDLPWWRCLYRVMRRRIRYAGRSRPDMSPQCPERLNWSFFHWIISYPFIKRPAILQKLKALPDTKAVYHLRSPEEVRQFLEMLGEAT